MGAIWSLLGFSEEETQDNFSDVSGGGKTVNVHIEYCGRWGYLPKAKALAATLNEAFGSKVSVKMDVGRASSFEIKVGDELVHSKLDGGGWPSHDSIKAAVEKSS